MDSGYGQCRDCRHWERDKKPFRQPYRTQPSGEEQEAPGEWHACARIGHGESWDGGPAVLLDPDQSGAWLVTRPDFGCALFVRGQAGDLSRCTAAGSQPGPDVDLDQETWHDQSGRRVTEQDALDYTTRRGRGRPTLSVEEADRLAQEWPPYRAPSDDPAERCPGKTGWHRPQVEDWNAGNRESTCTWCHAEISRRFADPVWRTPA